MSICIDEVINEDSGVAAYQEYDPEKIDSTLLTTIIDEDLGKLNGRQGKGVKSKYQILICYWSSADILVYSASYWIGRVKVESTWIQ